MHAVQHGTEACPGIHQLHEELHHLRPRIAERGGAEDLPRPGIREDLDEALGPAR